METKLATATWSKIGSDVRKKKTIDEVLKSSGLDYNVVKQPLYTGVFNDGVYSNVIKFNDNVATVVEGTSKVLGIVGKNYTVCQNKDAFDFVNYIDDEVTFVRAGQTYSGMVYVIAELPQVEVLGDSFVPNVIFQNGFNGGYTIKAAICPLRIACQNQFNVAFRDASNTVNIRHTSTMNDRLVRGREVFAATASYMKTLSMEAEKYAGIKLSKSKIVDIVEKDLFPTNSDMTPRQIESVTEKRTAFINAYNSEDNLNFRGSAWGAINAMSDFITHSEPTRKTKNWEDKKFMYVTFNQEFLANFIQLVESRAR
jgi:phage/plasmid-like protein (TIGR03299 family)